MKTGRLFDIQSGYQIKMAVIFVPRILFDIKQLSGYPFPVFDKMDNLITEIVRISDIGHLITRHMSSQVFNVSGIKSNVLYSDVHCIWILNVPISDPHCTLNKLQIENFSFFQQLRLKFGTAVWYLYVRSIFKQVLDTVRTIWILNSKEVFKCFWISRMQFSKGLYVRSITGLWIMNP